MVASSQEGLEAGDISQTICYRAIRKDGTRIWVEGCTRVIGGAKAGKGRDLVVILRDISERKKVEEQLAALAATDGLTGLANRRAFDEALEREWRRTLRAGSHMSLLLLDVDNVKKFNDHYGHQVGDDCLRAVAAATAKCVRRPGDLPARYGGEEMAVVLPETDAAGALDLASHIRESIEALHIPHEGGSDPSGFVTVSIGVATAVACEGGAVATPEGLLLAADTALYRAKREGRNRLATSLVLTPVTPAAS